MIITKLIVTAIELIGGVGILVLIGYVYVKIIEWWYGSAW